MQRANRRLEKKLKELVIQAEDERRHADQYKEQVRLVGMLWLVKGTRSTEEDWIISLSALDECFGQSTKFEFNSVKQVIEMMFVLVSL